MLQLIDNKLLIGEKPIELPSEVEKILNVYGVTIYLLNVPYDTINNRNIGALDKHGEHLWLIQEVESGAKYKHYDNLTIDNMNRVLAHNYLGGVHVVNIKDGTLKHVHSFTK